MQRYFECDEGYKTQGCSTVGVSEKKEKKVGAGVRGRAERFSGVYLQGWAYSGTERCCQIVVRDDQGCAIARGEATEERADLLALGAGRSDFGFRVPIMTLGDRPALHVLADGIELAGSPLRAGPGQFDGNLAVVNGFAVGSVSERVAKFCPPDIQILTGNGDVVARGPSSRIEGDEGPARFRIDLSALCGCGRVSIAAVANGVAFARAICNLRLVTGLEVATRGHCAGWIFSPDAHSARLAVEIRRDGQLVAIAPVNVARQDVRAVHPGSNAFGFDLKLPPPDAAPEEPCELSFRLAGSRKELFGGPFIVGEQAEIVATARCIATMVHDDRMMLSAAERAILQQAMAQYAASVRQNQFSHVIRKVGNPVRQSIRRMTIVIPVYRGLEISRDCIESVFKYRDPERDFVMVINDASPDPGMSEMLDRFARERNVHVHMNSSNLGFVEAVNFALRSIPEGDIVLLNSDARVFACGFEELYRAAHSSPMIGTVTPLSNNATIFSYPHESLLRTELEDVSWAQLAQLAVEHSPDTVVDVPTAHGFCMLIKREVLDCIHQLDTIFGRGYGEEVDFCAKAADLGFRNVATGRAFVYHHGSVSFGAERPELLASSAKVISNRYPEYGPMVSEFQRQDGMRSARWALDTARLTASRKAGTPFTLIITNWLEGGTAEFAHDIAKACEPANGRRLVLSCRSDRFIELCAEDPLIRATFAPSERRQLFRMLSAAQPALVAVQQVLGYEEDFIRDLASWIQDFRSVFHVHDYFSICPRVTMIDSSGGFCGRPAPDVCNRCIAIGGAHEASRLEIADVEEHRQLVNLLLTRVSHVIAPSAVAANYLTKTWPDLDVQVIGHPESGRQFPANGREGSDDEILVLGAIGPHKGSAKLLEIARLARLRYPQLRFRLVGYSDIDGQLLAAGNVQITGAYTRAELPRLMSGCRGRLALFLHPWPETWSYTLSEAVAYGFIPLVPDIGAPAERVRETGFGTVFPFPSDAQEVLGLIDDIAAGKRQPFRDGASPADYRTSSENLARLRAVFAVAVPTRAGARVA